MKSSLSFAKVWFIVSFAALAFLYGVAVGKWKWFPHSFLGQAHEQAKSFTQYVAPSLAPAPHFVHPHRYEKGVRTLKPERVQQGLTLISTNWMDYDWGAGIKLINPEGETVHQWRVDPIALSQGSSFGLPSQKNFAAPHGLHLFQNGDIVVEIRGNDGGVARLDACGDLVWRLPKSSGSWQGHHSVHASEDGSLWVSGARTVEPDWRGLQRFDEVNEDLAIHISPSGDVVNKVSILDVLYKNNLERYIPKSFEYAPDVDENDLTHLNDIEPLPVSISDQYPSFESGDLVVSLRTPDLIFVFDPISMEVKWHETIPFINQHDPDFIGNGWIGVFDNNQDFTGRGEMLGGSRVVALQPHTDSTKVLFPTQYSDPFYTPTAGEWELLKNGNMLLTETHAGRVVEVSQDGRTVWEWVNKPYGEGSVTEVFEAKRLQIATDQIASWPCSSVDSVDTSSQKQQTAP